MRLDEADHKTAQHRARNVPDAAEDRGGEGFETGLETVEEPGRSVVHAADETRRPGKRAADQERHRDRRVDVDAHQLGRVTILGGRPHRLPDFRLRNEELQATIMTIASAMTSDRLALIETPPRSTVGLGMKSGNGIGEGPFQSCITFSRMNDMPMAVISGASRGALRSRDRRGARSGRR